jgi:hypothetical protein
MTIRIKKHFIKEESSFKKVLIKLFSEKVKEKDFARKLYDCLCNTVWYNKLTDDIYSCSFRYAGGLIAEMRDQGEDYLDFYCNSFSGEGTYHKEIYEPLNNIGYQAIKFKEFDSLQKYKFTGNL